MSSRNRHLLKDTGRRHTCKVYLCQVKAALSTALPGVPWSPNFPCELQITQRSARLRKYDRETTRTAISIKADVVCLRLQNACLKGS